MIFFIRLLIIFFVVTNCYAEQVGASVGGGILFCVSDTLESIPNCKTEGSGDYGLIMAVEDQANYEISKPKTGITWSKEYSVTQAQNPDNGAINTDMIIKARPQDDKTNNAAYLCRDYRGGGFPDWYLPSKNELNKMYSYAEAKKLIGKNCGGRTNNMQCLIGDEEKNPYYWSSTEYELASYSASLAWLQDFSNGYQNGNSKGYSWFGVRAVRVFSPLTLKPFNESIEEQNKQAKEEIVKAVDVAANTDNEVKDVAVQNEPQKIIEKEYFDEVMNGVNQHMNDQMLIKLMQNLYEHK